MVFNHYDSTGNLADYVLVHLQVLKTMGFSIVFVTTAPALTATAVHRVAPLCWMVLLRPNRGLDLGGWPCAVKRIEFALGQPLQRALSRLVIANDSVFGPLRPLAPVFDSMARRHADIWGITESIEREPHLQSYFLVFERRGLTFVRGWLRQFQFLEDKDALVSKFEIGLSRQARLLGLNLQALVPYSAVQQLVVNEPGMLRLAVRERFTQMHGRVNPTHVFWRELLVQLGSPYIKRDLLRKPDQLDPAAESCMPFLAANFSAEACSLIAGYLTNDPQAQSTLQVL